MPGMEDVGIEPSNKRESHQGHYKFIVENKLIKEIHYTVDTQ